MPTLLNVKSLSLAIWLLTNTLLIGGIGNHLQWGSQILPPLPTPAVHLVPPAELVLMPNHRLPPLGEKYRDTLTRPLFVPTRRKAPPIPPPPPPPKPTMQKGQFQLLGTLLDANHTYAMLRELNGGKHRRVTQGERINGILVSSIGPDKVVLSQYDEEEVLPIKVMPSPKAPPVPTTQATPPAQQAGLSGAASARLVPASASQRTRRAGDEDAQQKPRQRRPLTSSTRDMVDSPSASGGASRPPAPAQAGIAMPPN